jgi:hypothetical protein
MEEALVLDYRQVARVRLDQPFGMSNGGWAYDNYPELETLDAHSRITIADLEGPGVITCIHSTQHGIWASDIKSLKSSAYYARGVLIELYYNGAEQPAVRVPIGDFFGDGAGGAATRFSSLYVEKAPESYNSFIPMPFEQSVRVVLVNETDQDLSNYSFVEWHRLPEWEPDLGYLQATWHREAFQLGNDTDHHFFHAKGPGVFLGRTWSIVTDEPYFDDFHFVMEGNNEYRLDGNTAPVADYLGTEDSFGFSWGFRHEFAGLYNGINHVHRRTPSTMSLYRFHGTNRIPFAESIDLRINWSHEWNTNETFQREIAALTAADRGWVDYATTFYWYQINPGHDHKPLIPLAKRAATILHPNPIDSIA